MCPFPTVCSISPPNIVCIFTDAKDVLKTHSLFSLDTVYLCESCVSYFLVLATHSVVQHKCNLLICFCFTVSKPESCMLTVHVGHVLQLLQNKANINAVNEHGNTPLHYACFWNYEQLAEVCIIDSL